MSLPQSSRFKVPLSLVDLNADCLFQIFSYLSLPDLLNFRLQCSSLNDTICKYLPHLTTLSIVYSEHSLTASRPEVENEIKDRIHDDLLQTHFRREDFIVVSGQKKYEKLLEFIRKYEIRNIKKFALIVDYERDDVEPPLENFSEISMVFDLLEFCPKVETLFLEHTGPSFVKLSFNNEDFHRLFQVIDGLSSLKELHLFALRKFRPLYLQSKNYIIYDNSKRKKIFHEALGKFLWQMFSKLRVFKISAGISSSSGSYNPTEYLTPILRQNFDDILEVGFESYDCLKLVNSGTKFSNLRSLTISGAWGSCYFQEYVIRNSFDKLNILQFYEQVQLTDRVMLNLNSLPNLQKLRAGGIVASQGYLQNVESMEDGYINTTIKHIQVENARTSRANFSFCPYTDFFEGLLTVTILKPEAVVYERHNFDEITIEKR